MRKAGYPQSLEVEMPKMKLWKMRRMITTRTQRMWTPRFYSTTQTMAMTMSPSGHAEGGPRASDQERRKEGGDGQGKATAGLRHQKKQMCKK
jgi:hypothetical protein